MEEENVSAHKYFDNIFWIATREGKEKLATINSTPGESVYSEKLILHKRKEFRIWDPYRSKLAAAIIKKIRYLPISQDSRILYLGAATGTTASHIDDIVGKKGKVYCVEFSQRAVRVLIEQVCSKRKNMYPILADARFPERYGIINGYVDAIYCDIAQPEQAKILAANSYHHLKMNGGIMLAIKSRSIDVTQSPEKIFMREIKVLKENGFKIKDNVKLDPFEKDHAMVTAIYRRN